MGAYLGGQRYVCAYIGGLALQLCQPSYISVYLGGLALHLCLPWWPGATSVSTLVAWRYICVYLDGPALYLCIP